MTDRLPASMPPNVRAALAEAKARLAALYGERLERVVLYGSHARGDARPDSDVDLLVVLRGEVEPYTEIKRTGLLALDLLLDYGADVSIQPYGVEDAADTRRSFTRNVAADGVAL
jgi:predicted nucleotidyltransferase